MTTLYESSKAILREASYVGAGTCEFLVGQDGTISFLEVNTRLQVEHPVSEEVTGLDLVREMFRIAAGEELGYDDPKVEGHSIEYRINAEDPGSNFMPAPGTLTRWHAPAGPGRPARRRLRPGRDRPRLVRLPGGQADRHRPRPHPGARALAPRAGRVRRRRHADGDPVPPGRGRRPRVRRRRRDRSASTPAGSRPSSTTRSRRTPATSEALEAAERQSVTVEVGGRRLEVVLPAGFAAGAAAGAGAQKKPKREKKKAGAAASGDSVTSPMQGTIVKVAVEDGPGGRRGRRHRGPRGDEDGAAAQGPQGRHRHRADRRRRRQRHQRRRGLRAQGLTIG